MSPGMGSDSSTSTPEQQNQASMVEEHKDVHGPQASMVEEHKDVHGPQDEENLLGDVSTFISVLAREIMMLKRQIGEFARKNDQKADVASLEDNSQFRALEQRVRKLEQGQDNTGEPQNIEASMVEEHKDVHGPQAAAPTAAELLVVDDGVDKTEDMPGGEDRCLDAGSDTELESGEENRLHNQQDTASRSQPSAKRTGDLGSRLKSREQLLAKASASAMTGLLTMLQSRKKTKVQGRVDVDSVTLDRLANLAVKEAVAAAYLSTIEDPCLFMDKEDNGDGDVEVVEGQVPSGVESAPKTRVKRKCLRTTELSRVSSSSRKTSKQMKRNTDSRTRHSLISKARPARRCLPNNSIHRESGMHGVWWNGASKRWVVSCMKGDKLMRENFPVYTFQRVDGTEEEAIQDALQAAINFRKSKLVDTRLKDAIGQRGSSKKGRKT
eukprot:TRINITY_DN1068_c0_g1_i3.p1 TRINITY_DN1068_c0_g1~~TRINITY_DN1068_c0_g1_i3.p1  ORF type:complete len:457 (-),score=108.72 TRINITY_DN1068_c0_g1_i3:76-1392(-)